MRKPLSHLLILLCNVTKDRHLWSRNCHVFVSDSTARMWCYALAVWWSKIAPGSPHKTLTLRRTGSHPVLFEPSLFISFFPIASLSDMHAPGYTSYVSVFFFYLFGAAWLSVKIKVSHCMCRTCCCVYTTALERGGDFWHHVKSEILHRDVALR